MVKRKFYERSLPQTAMEAAHEFAQMLRTGSKILVVTGAGVEYDLGNPNPNPCHRLCALVTATGGAHVTTNISGVQLLSQPNEQKRNHISFVPVRGILYDQQKGRAGSDGCEWRRPRCMSDAKQPLLQGRRITVPIPVGSVEDEDPNMVAARASAKGKTFLLILGNSLPTNGRALHFLVAADSVKRVIFVNIDSSRDGTAIAEALEAWGLPVCAQVTCVAMRAEEFADAVLHFAAEASQPAQLREVVEISKHWVQKEKVNEMRRLILLPPKSELSVEEHSFGPAEVTAGEIYDLQKAAAAAAAVQPAAQPVKKGESEESHAATAAAAITAATPAATTAATPAATPATAATPAATPATAATTAATTRPDPPGKKIGSPVPTRFPPQWREGYRPEAEAATAAAAAAADDTTNAGDRMESSLDSLGKFLSSCERERQG